MWLLWVGESADTSDTGLRADGEEQVLRAHEAARLSALFLIAGQHPEA